MTLRPAAIAVCAVVGACAAGADEPAPTAMRGDVLYHMRLVRAAPGRLLDLVAAMKGHGLVLRHSQGDQWDLMVLSPFRLAELSQAPASLVEASLIAWQEDSWCAVRIRAGLSRRHAGGRGDSCAGVSAAEGEGVAPVSSRRRGATPART